MHSFVYRHYSSFTLSLNSRYSKIATETRAPRCRAIHSPELSTCSVHLPANSHSKDHYRYMIYANMIEVNVSAHYCYIKTDKWCGSFITTLFCTLSFFSRRPWLSDEFHRYESILSRSWSVIHGQQDCSSWLFHRCLFTPGRLTWAASSSQ